MARRTNKQIAADRVTISEYYLQGKPQREIAELMGFSIGVVNREIEAIRQAWAESPLINFNEAINRELARLDLIEREAWAAYERSKEPREIRTQSGGEGLPARATISRQNQNGDEKYLRIALECVDRRIKLLGLEKLSVDVTSNGETVLNADVLHQIMRHMDARTDGGDSD